MKDGVAECCGVTVAGMMATDAMAEMEAKKLTYMPVIGENNKLEGVVTLKDLVVAGL